MTAAIRTAADPRDLAASVRRALAAIDPELPLYGVRTMAERIDESLTDKRTPMIMAVAFGAVALLLAAIGLSGVLAYQVAQRRREIGIRIALGSEPRGIFGLVLREGVWLVGVGSAIGLAGAFAIGRGLESQLYGVRPMEPGVVAAVVLLLSSVALFACIVPARRAARIDPVVALTE